MTLFEIKSGLVRTPTTDKFEIKSGLVRTPTTDKFYFGLKAEFDFIVHYNDFI